jgi:dTDP-4-dehydrorhamnose reductase
MAFSHSKLKTQNSKLRLLVTGSDGLVGQSILPALGEEFDVVPYVESQWDICDRKKSEAVIADVGPDVLLNLAAITNVDGCEEQEELAFRVNGEAAGLLAGICASHNARIVSFSTDYVFDGRKTSPYTEDDPTNPLSVYGKSKMDGEEKILAYNPSSAIVRTEWVYGDQGESFITKVVRAAKQRGRVEVVNDQKGTPTYAADLAHPVAALIKQERRGIYHVTNEGSCTWYEFAQYIFSFLGMNVVCTPIATAESERKAKRPANSVLDCAKLRADTNIRMRTWQDAVNEYLRKFQASFQ